MERSKILTEEIREALAKYPQYSQDGKGGRAVALMRLYITGTAATFYILEGEPRGEYEGREEWHLYGLSNMERGEGFRYDYFSLAELEGLNMYGGLVRLERDEHFNPCELSEIAEVAANCSGIWKKETEEHTNEN